MNFKVGDTVLHIFSKQPGEILSLNMHNIIMVKLFNGNRISSWSPGLLPITEEEYDEAVVIYKLTGDRQ